MPHWMVSWVPCFAKKWFLDVAQENPLFSAWQGTVAMWHLVASLANEHTLVPPNNVSTTRAPPHITPKLNMMKTKLLVNYQFDVPLGYICKYRPRRQGELAEITSRKWQKTWSLTIWWLEYLTNLMSSYLSWHVRLPWTNLIRLRDKRVALSIMQAGFAGLAHVFVGYICSLMRLSCLPQHRTNLVNLIFVLKFHKLVF
jgi:hypothetical protein